MTNKVNYNIDYLRDKNRGRVFEQLVTNDGVYRVDLAKSCGLTKMAISKIVNEFLEKDIIVETAKNEEQKMGRKSTMLCLSQSVKKIIGLLIHRNYVSAVLCDCKLNAIRANTIRFTECDRESLLEMVFSLVDEMMKDSDVIGIGVGSIGPVSPKQGMILNPPEFYGIKDVPIVNVLQEKYKIPVYLDYHYNCAARAEKYFGSGKKYRNFVLLGIEEGVGISIVTDRKILTRMTGTSSELGHITVDHNGPKCFCGRRGCLGQYMDFKNEEKTWDSVRILSSVLMGIFDLMAPQTLIIRDPKSVLKEEHYVWLENELNDKMIIGNYQKIKVLPAYREKEEEAVVCATNILGRIFGGEIEI